MDGASTKIRGYGKTRPAAPNTNADGSDSPAGRRTNRRVEIAIDTCS
jgi:OOP family OmpA-OmpF porin